MQSINRAKQQHCSSLISVDHKLYANISYCDPKSNRTQFFLFRVVKYEKRIERKNINIKHISVTKACQTSTNKQGKFEISKRLQAKPRFKTPCFHLDCFFISLFIPQTLFVDEYSDQLYWNFSRKIDFFSSIAFYQIDFLVYIFCFLLHCLRCVNRSRKHSLRNENF